MKAGRLLLRATVGGFFVGHGTQKLFGWFGGSGVDGTSQMFEKIGMYPPRVNAVAAGAAEAGGGAGLLLGFQTPLAASAVVATMLTAINRVHYKNGPWVTKGGYEYNAVLIAAALILAEVGPGSLSVDGIRGRERSGPGWALAALGAGVAGAAGAHLLSEAQKPAVAAPAPTPAPTPAGEAQAEVERAADAVGDPEPAGAPS